MSYDEMNGADARGRRAKSEYNEDVDAYSPRSSMRDLDAIAKSLSMLGEALSMHEDKLGPILGDLTPADMGDNSEAMKDPSQPSLVRSRLLTIDGQIRTITQQIRDLGQRVEL